MLNLTVPPDDVAMARVIKYGGRNIHLHFNYRSRFNEIWDESTLKQNHGYETFYPEGDDTSLVDKCQDIVYMFLCHDIVYIAL